MPLRSPGAALTSLPRWALALPAFGLGLAVTMWLDVLPRDAAVYLGAAAAFEVFADFRAWLRSSRASRREIVEAEIMDVETTPRNKLEVRR